MRLMGCALALMLLAAMPAAAQSSPNVGRPLKLTPAAANAMAGEWRAHRKDQGDPCGRNAQPDDVTFTLEFALTGGRLAFNDGSEDSGAARIVSVVASKDSLDFTFDDGRHWDFIDVAQNRLSSGTAPSGWDSDNGLRFYQCRKAANRGAIHLNRPQTAAISHAMAGGPVLVDLRAKTGCNALQYQYLDFDLVGPLGFTLHRWNSWALAERLAGNLKPAVASDEVGDFTIDKADAIPGGYRFTVTELIPPNGGRGDTTTITVLMAKDRTATIPEWKRRYALCTAPK